MGQRTGSPDQRLRAQRVDQLNPEDIRRFQQRLLSRKVQEGGTMAVSTARLLWATGMAWQVRSERSVEPRDLRKMIKVLIPGEERQVVLHHQRGYPDVVGGNRCSLAAQLKEQLTVVVCG